MTRKFLIVLLAMIILSGCSSSGVSQEEYDEVVAENEILSNKIELESKVAEFQARIEEQYEHAKFVIYIGGIVAEMDDESALSALESSYDVAKNDIDSIKNILDTAIELNVDGVDMNEYIAQIDTIYDTWREYYEMVLEVEGHLMDE